MDEKLIEKGDAYTMGFVVQKGGIETVAKRTGINRQTMRQVATGRNAPGFDFIMKMVAAYPDYDIRKSVPTKSSTLVTAGSSEESMGSYSDYVEMSDSSTGEAKVLAVENAGLRNEIARLEQTVEILRSVVSSQLGKDMESKSESVNDPTRGEQLAIGLNWGIKRADSPMIKLPITSVRPMGRTWSDPVRRSPKR